MTQQEFEQLTGTNVTSAEYLRIENVYMADLNQSKQEFCKMWVKTPKSAQEMMIDMTLDLQATKDDLLQLTKSNDELLDIMFERTQKMSDPELRKSCIKHMGEKVYIQKLLQGKYNLWEDDRDLIIQNLK